MTLSSKRCSVYELLYNVHILIRTGKTKLLQILSPSLLYGIIKAIRIQNIKLNSPLFTPPKIHYCCKNRRSPYLLPYPPDKLQGLFPLANNIQQVFITSCIVCACTNLLENNPENGNARYSGSELLLYSLLHALLMARPRVLMNILSIFVCSFISNTRCRFYFIGGH